VCLESEFLITGGHYDFAPVRFQPGDVTEIHPRDSEASVETTQVAPTILQALGLDPNFLDAAQKEGTQFCLELISRKISSRTLRSGCFG